MKKLMAWMMAMVCVSGLIGCSGRPVEDAVQADKQEEYHFHGKVFRKSDLSQETIQWLVWYTELSESEQLSISYIPDDLYELCGYGAAQDIPAETE